MDKEKRFVRFHPDTAGSRVWHHFLDSSGVKRESLQGKLVLTDRWKRKDTMRFGYSDVPAWYNSRFFPEKAVVSKGQIRDDNTADINVSTMFSKLGLTPESFLGRYDFEEQYGEYYGYKKLSVQLRKENMSFTVKFLGGEPSVGDKYGFIGNFDLWTYPSETDPSFKPHMLQLYIMLVVTIVN